MLRLTAPKLWATRGLIAWLLLPVSWVYMGLISARRACYRTGIFRTRGFDKPVIVVGGIAVGGSGKTPAAMHVVRLLAARGFRPGIVSRGYGGQSVRRPLVVDRHTPAEECGDEPAMMARSLATNPAGKIPIVVDANRPRAVVTLISDLGCDIVVSDDGLQHYAMGRQVEIAVVNQRSIGNGYCLPAGPLREPMSRLAEVDIVVDTGGVEYPGAYTMLMTLEELVSIDGTNSRPLSELRDQRVHAVAGTGHPEGFFCMLKTSGLEFETHVFPDHHRYRGDDFAAMGDLPIVMTEKDAVKCRDLRLKDAWYAPLEASLDERFASKLIELLKI